MTRRSTRSPRRAVRHDRHGRAGRSLVTGPELPPVGGRIDFFESVVASTADYLRGAWKTELAGVRFEVGAMPPSLSGDDGIDRWWTSTSERRIVIYRLPVQRLGTLHQNDDAHRRMLIEGIVFRATAEYVGREPWDLGADRFRL